MRARACVYVFRGVQHYGNLFFLLQTKPKYMARLARQVGAQWIDSKSFIYISGIGSGKLNGPLYINS